MVATTLDLWFDSHSSSSERCSITTVLLVRVHSWITGSNPSWEKKQTKHHGYRFRLTMASLEAQIRRPAFSEHDVRGLLRISHLYVFNLFEAQVHKGAV